ncbi:MAG: hypothetical protein L3J46_03315 [Kangiellaceae bacterium]|nr:hypothetical protein [Kangiellaceae bacterium]
MRRVLIEAEKKLYGSLDGLINGLPLYEPTGQFNAYQRSNGSYTDVHLMTRQGDERDRLIPDITKIRYIDWK